MEPNNPKKIQFSVPPLQKSRDPKTAEHIRRRRPTPATLVTYHEPDYRQDRAHSDKTVTSPPAEGLSSDLSLVQRKQVVYVPPVHKGTRQKTQTDTVSPLAEEEEEEAVGQQQWKP